VISGEKPFANAEALMTYGADYADQIRRSPCYVDTMFKGRKRNHLPVEQPTKLDGDQ